MPTVVVPFPPGVARLEAELVKLTKLMTEGVERDAEKNWSAHVETGATLASVHSTVTGRTGRVWVHGRVWHFVEYGTAPHIIASRGGPLKYPLANRAKRFFAYPGLVSHPGNREFAPMRNALYRKRGPRGGGRGPSLFGGG